MNVRIFPHKSPSTIAEFLSKHGFNVGPLTKEGFFVVALTDQRGAIDTLQDLARIQAEPKFEPKYDFHFEEEPKDANP